MPAPQPRRAGAPIWIELDSPDPEVSARFYRGLLHVEVSDPSEQYGGLRNVQHAGGSIAAIMPTRGDDPGGWVVYLHTPDLDRAVDLVRDAGGSVTLEPGAVGAAGRLAMIEDPSGASVGLWEPGEQYGVQVVGEPGAPGWYELHATSGYRETVRFYEQALGWDVSVMGDSEQFRMVTDGAGPDAVAGIYDASDNPMDERSLWQVYFFVEDADAAAAFVAANGGTVLDGPTDTPFGRMSHLVDPLGARISIMQPPAD